MLLTSLSSEVRMMVWYGKHPDIVAVVIDNENTRLHGTLLVSIREAFL